MAADAAIRIIFSIDTLVRVPIIREIPA